MGLLLAWSTGNNISLYSFGGHPGDNVAACLEQEGDAVGEAVHVDTLFHLWRRKVKSSHPYCITQQERKPALNNSSVPINLRST